MYQVYTNKVLHILNEYAFENISVRGKLFKLFNSGALSGTGKLLIYAIDQGFEHGADASFATNHEAYNPEYHYNLAIESGCSALVGSIGFLQTATAKYPGILPTILKLNSNNILINSDYPPTQAITASVDDAIRLGCDAIGLTIYPGSAEFNHMITELSDIISEAKAKGLPVIIWSYPRGDGINNSMAVDVISYGAQIACQIGANIVKVKIPSCAINNPKIGKLYTENGISFESQLDCIKIVINSCFSGKKIVIFSGGEKKGDMGIMSDVQSIYNAGGYGSIIGRNIFQRNINDAKNLIKNIINVYNL